MQSIRDNLDWTKATVKHVTSLSTTEIHKRVTRQVKGVQTIDRQWCPKQGNHSHERHGASRVQKEDLGIGDFIATDETVFGDK